MKTKIIIIILSCILWSCKDAEIKSSEFPLLLTEAVTEIDADGATFKADILNPGKDAVIDFGFIWDDGSNEFKISVLNTADLNNFKARINTDLILDQTYSCKAYVQTTKYLVYGNKVVFKSLGSLKPIITDFSPKVGFDGDTVVIKGQYFSSVGLNNKVFVNNVDAILISSNDSTIVFRMPMQTFIGQVAITVEVNETKVTLDSKFNILGPTIKSLSSMSGYSGNVITMKGTNFMRNGSNLELYFSTFKADIISSNDSIIEFVVPNPVSYLSQYLLQDMFFMVSITNGKKTVSLSSSFKILKFWEQKAATPFSWSYKYQAVSYNGKGYILELNDKHIYEYNPGVNAWNQYTANSSVFPGERYDRSLFIVWKDVLYKMGGADYDNKPYYEVWAFNFESKKWTKKNNLTFSLTNGTYFTLNNQLYIVTGLGEVWKCDLENQIYTQMKNYPNKFDFSYSSAFVLNGKAYVVDYGQTWLYNEQSDSWTNIAPNPFMKDYSNASAIGYALNNNAYVLYSGRYLYKFNIANAKWSQISNYPGMRGDNSYKTTFVIGKKAYIAATSGNYVGNSPLMYSFGE